MGVKVKFVLEQLLDAGFNLKRDFLILVLVYLLG